MKERERLHSLIDTLPDTEVHAALRFLEYLESEGASFPLEGAPLDDEPLTAEEKEALAEAERDLNEGRLVSHEEARRRLLSES
jgi:hypothetical protein